MNQTIKQTGSRMPILCGIAADLLFDFLLVLAGLNPWLALLLAWIIAVCVGKSVSMVLKHQFPCTLSFVLNEWVYCGLEGIPTLLADGLLFFAFTKLSFFTEAPIFNKLISAVIAALLFPFVSGILREPLKKLNGILNEETVSYLFFGAVTTLVNIVIHWILSEKLGILPMVSNTLAWLGAVLVAYVTNRRFVFQSHTRGAALWREIGLFITARLLSLGVDEGGMALCLYVFHMDNMLSKVLLNVIVIILNYFASKWMIFGQKKP